MKSFVFGCLATAFSLIILNTLCWFIRIELPGFFPSSEDPVNFQSDRFLLFRMTGNITWEQQIYPGYLGIDYTLPVKTNDLGFRDRLYDPEKPKGTYRILCLGDSSTFGHGVRFQETFAKRLEALLKPMTHPRFEVMNAGVSGYSSLLGLEMFTRELLLYKPDCVVIGFASNDSFTGLLGDYGTYTDRELLERMHSQRRSALYRLTATLRKTSLYRVMRHLVSGAKQKKSRKNRPKIPRVNLQEYNQNLIRFLELCRDHEIEVIFLGVGPEKRIRPYREEMKKIASRHGKPFLDVNCLLHSRRQEAKTAERFRQYRDLYRSILGDRYELADCGDSLIYGTVDCEHPNAIGHQFIAEALLGILCQKGIISHPKVCASGTAVSPCVSP